MNMSPDEIINEAKGDEGAAERVFRLNEMVVRAERLKQKYIVCNADELRPGTFKDRYLMERDPHALIEGNVDCGVRANSQTCYIYTRAWRI